MCRECPNISENGKKNYQRKTNWYCDQCKVAFHPDCFHTFHQANSPNYMPRKRMKPSFGVTPGSDTEV
jgi:hypothetical protein